MAAPLNNNKESFRLLDMSSDSESEDLQLQIAPVKKKKVIRKRNRGMVSAPVEVQRSCPLHWCARGAALLWLAALTVLLLALQQQTAALADNLHKGLTIELGTHLDLTSFVAGVNYQVSTCSESVSGSLQELHAGSKALEAARATLGARLDALEAAHGALLDNVTLALRALDALRHQLDAAPQLTEVPGKLDILQKSIGELGSRIGSLEKTSENTKTAATAASKDLEGIQARLAALDHRLNTSLAEDVIRAQKVESLEANLTARVDQLRIDLERAKATTSTSTSTPTATTPATTSTSTTTTTPITTTMTTSTNLTVPAQVPSKPLKTGAM